MKTINNYNNLKSEKNNQTKKSVAEYIYIKKSKFGKKVEKKFISKYVSTIDIPYAKYILK